MSCGLGVVVFPQNVYLYSLDCWYVHSSIIQNYPLRIGGEGLEPIWRIFITSRQGGVSYLRKVETNFGVLIKGSEDIFSEGVFRCSQSHAGYVKEVGG